MADKIIIQFPSGSISDGSLGFIGDPVTGSLSQTSYRAMKDYFQQGIVVNTGSLATTASLNAAIATIVNDLGEYTFTGSFNTFSSSYHGDSGSNFTRISNVFSSQSNYLSTGSYLVDSSSFNSRISSITGSSVNTGSLLLTSSFNTYTASIGLQVGNVYASESNYLLTGSFLPFSASVNSQILAITASGGGVSITIFNNFTSSVSNQFGQYETTSSFNAFSASVNSRLTGSAGSSVSSSVLNFLVGDGQSFTPFSGSTVFSSSLIAGKSILQFSQEGLPLAPISRSVAWFTSTSSIGQLNLNNTTFVPNVFYQIIFT